MPEKELMSNQELLPTEDKTRSNRKSLVINIKNPATKKVIRVEDHKTVKFKGIEYNIRIIKIGIL